MLSVENREKIIPTGLYAREIDERTRRGGSSDPYWCTNWTFVPRISENEITLIDSYYKSYQDSISYVLDDGNINDFKLIFDFNDVREVNQTTYREYSEDDRFWVACDSGGRKYPKYFVKKTASPNKDLQLYLIDSEIESLEYQLERLKEKRKSIFEN
ncbi:hypothetical protein ABQE21_05425 [Enterococcus casseliflavus]|uniref:hypothetical protein n=1 Tax=Enterococcus casseliflavus TaxID=37734 RepID=UPI001918A69B|nr:hypothetical protein [Enterococcus casseliflavus]QQU16534.1 hypothetical protein I6I79_00645 [Enterococcus casseliflavus]